MDEEKPYLPGSRWKFKLKNGFNFGGRILECNSLYLDMMDDKTDEKIRIYHTTEISFSKDLTGDIPASECH